MLEKLAGIALVTKIRVILLMEANFNFCNRLIFAKRMLDTTWAHDLIPEEVYNEKWCTAKDALLQQVLIFDIACQRMALLIVASIDASQ